MIFHQFNETSINRFEPDSVAAPAVQTVVRDRTAHKLPTPSVRSLPDSAIRSESVSLQSSHLCRAGSKYFSGDLFIRPNHRRRFPPFRSIAVTFFKESFRHFFFQFIQPGTEPFGNFRMRARRNMPLFFFIWIFFKII